VVNSLLLLNANLDTTDNKRLTPLHCAVVANKLNIVQVLVDSGIDVDAQNTDMMTALQYIKR
jgi:ankyrin repeat protein